MRESVFCKWEGKATRITPRNTRRHPKRVRIPRQSNEKTGWSKRMIKPKRRESDPEKARSPFDAAKSLTAASSSFLRIKRSAATTSR